jgi:hypothetical protein
VDASSQLQDLQSEFRLREIRELQTDHNRRRRAEPSACLRGTPRSVAIVTSPVRWTRSLSRWSCRCCGREAAGMRMIIGRNSPVQSLKTLGHPPTSDEPPRRVVRDDNSRRELRNVRGDSCARNYEMSAAFSVTTTGQPRRDGPVERGTERALVGTNSAAERPAIAARGAFQPGAGHIAYGCPHAGPSFTIPVRQSSCIDAIQGLPDPESQCAFTGRQLQKVTSGLH